MKNKNDTGLCVIVHFNDAHLNQTENKEVRHRIYFFDKDILDNHSDTEILTEMIPKMLNSSAFYTALKHKYNKTKISYNYTMLSCTRAKYFQIKKNSKRYCRICKAEREEERQKK